MCTTTAEPTAGEDLSAWASLRRNSAFSSDRRPKSPRNPDATSDPDDLEQTESDVEPPEGEGLDQGAVARVQETLTAVAFSPDDEWLATGYSNGVVRLWPWRQLLGLAR